MRRLWFAVCVILLICGCSGNSGGGSGDNDNSETPAVAAIDGPGSVPSEPSSLDTQTVTASRVELTWVDNADNEEGFLIERSLDPDFNNFAQLDVRADRTFHRDTGLDADTRYYYRIRAHNQAGYSPYSDPVTVTTQNGSDEDPRLVFAYGFEDWTGDAGTTPGYFSSNNHPTYWRTHVLATEVVASDHPGCGGREAYEGDYYYHQNFFTGGLDPCLGTIPDSINPHTNIGINLPYPSDPKSNFDISSAITSTTMTIRFYFRTTGNWPNAVANNLKFIRVIGELGGQTSILHISEDGTTFDISDHPHPDDPEETWGDYHNPFTAPINWNDGLWHSVVMVVERLNDQGIAPNLNVSVWWDDWNMDGPADGSAEVYANGFGTSISHIALFVNWGATYPDSSMGIDLDNIEIWNGRP